MPFAKNLKLLKSTALFVGIFLIAFTPLLYPKHVSAASYTWDGGGTDGTCGGNAGDGNKWSCAANWSSDIVPVAGDTVTFNATSTKDAVIDSSFGGTITTINMSAGYTGTITQQRSLTVSSNFNLDSGIFNASNQTLSIGGGFTFNSGTFTASSATTTITGGVDINGGTFNHNNGTVIFAATNNRSLQCGNVTFNQVNLSHGGGLVYTIENDCSLPLGNNPTINGSFILNGTLSGSGTLTLGNTTNYTINATGALSGFTGLVNGSGSGLILTGPTIDFTSYTTFSPGLFTLNSGSITVPSILSLTTFTQNGGTFNAASGTMTVTGAFTITAGTFNHNNGTLVFGGITTATLACNNQIFNLVQFTHTTGTKTIGADCSFNVGADPLVTGPVTLNGTMTGTGYFQTNNSLTLSAGSTFTGFSGFVMITGTLTVNNTWNASSWYTPYFYVQGAFILNSGAVFTAPTGTMTVTSAFTLNAGSVFNHNNGTLNFNSTGTGTLSCNNAVFNLVTFTINSDTTTFNTKTVGSNCILPLGNNPRVNANIVLNGTLTGTGIYGSPGLLTLNNGSNFTGFTGIEPYYGSSPFAAGSGLTIGASKAFDASTFTKLDLDNTFITNTGSSFTAPAVMSVGRGMTLVAGTFTHNNGTIIFDGTVAGTLTCNSNTFNSVIFAHTLGIKTVASSCNFPIGTNPTFPASGSLTLNGTLTGSGTLTVNGTFTMNTGSSLNCFTIDADTFIYNGGSICGGTAFIWDGGGTDGTCGGNVGDGNKWSCAANWLSDTVPGALDPVQFDTTSTKDSIIDSAFSGNVLAITIASGYTGTITQQRSLTMQGFFAQSAGTFAGSNNRLSMVSSFTLNSGATFNAPSAELNITGAFTINSGSTFNHNNGTVNFETSTATAILSCNNATFNLVTFKYYGVPNGSVFTKGVSSNCSFPLGNNPVVEGFMTLAGSFTGSGTYYTPFSLTMNNGSNFTGFSAIEGMLSSNANAQGGALFLGSSKVFNASSYTHITLGSGFGLNASSVFTAPPALTVGGQFTVNSTATFNHNNGTIYITDPTVATTAIMYFWCPNTTTFNRVVFQHENYIRHIEGAAAGLTCNFPVGHNPIISGPIMIGEVSNFIGVISGTGTITFEKNVIHTSIGTISGFDEVIFNDTYSYTTPTFTNVDKITFNNPQTFSTTFNGSQVPEIQFNDDVSFTGGTFTSPASMKVAGDFSNSGGTFTHNNGTVEFIGSGIKTITGNTAFNNLKVDSTDSPTLTFTAGSTQTVGGLLTLKGRAGSLVTLKSTTTGSAWNLNNTGTYDIEYVNVSDSTASSTITVGCDSFDGGNNILWEFGENCAPSVFNLGPTETVSGGSIDTKQPTFTFSISDPNPLDLIQYTIEIDNNSDFSSPEVCYTSAFITPGSFSFTVGQPAGSGTYSCGSEDQTLADGTYYWRIVVVDSSGYSSGYKVANGGDVAFKVVASFGSGNSSNDNPFVTIPDLSEIIDPTLPETGSDTPEVTIDDLANTKTPLKLWHLIVCISPVILIVFIMFIPVLKKKKKQKI